MTRTSVLALGAFLILSAAVAADETFRYPEGKHGKGELSSASPGPWRRVA